MKTWKQAGFKPVGHFVFLKDYASNQRFARYQHESAYLLAKGEPEKPANPPSDVLEWKYTGNTLHPTQKPIEILTHLIKAYSDKGDIVLDPFAGSGTTAVAAHQLGRRYIGIEIDETYSRTARSRLRELRHYKHNQETTMTYSEKGDIEKTVDEFKRLLDETKLTAEEKDKLIEFVGGKLKEIYWIGKKLGIKQRKRSAA